MTSDLTRAQELFDALCQLSAHERSRRLEELREEDDGLATLVAGLLQSHDAVQDSTLASAANLLEPAIAEQLQLAPGTRVGNWQVDERIGMGGMGTVYRVSRSDGTVELTAALKLIRAELLDAGSRDRFLRERQILASLDHPNIARLIDAGDFGESPYYVMEYVDGHSISTYCDAVKATIDHRLHLFRDVLRAVEYAHRHLVIHRDLKPDNLLVDDDGKPRVVDFGIATLATQVTSMEDRALSPNYAAPEQFSGAPATTACDIYALGAILYELICGQRALDRRSTDTASADILKAPSRRVVALPDAAGAASTRGLTSPRQLQRRVAGDLDAICLRALETDPERRYRSAAEMDADIAAHMSHRPIAARETRVPRRALLLVRRNPVATLASGMALVLAVTLLISLAMQSVRLAAGRDRGEEVLEVLVETFRSADPTHTLGEQLTARHVLTNGALRMQLELDDQPEMRTELSHTIVDVLMTLGLYEDASELLSRFRPVKGPVEQRIRHDYLVARLNHELAQYDKADEMTRSILADPDLNDAMRADVLELRASILGGSGERFEALDVMRNVHALRSEILGERDPRTLQTQREIARALGSLGKNEEALELVLDVLPALQEALPAGHPEVAATHKLASSLHRRAGNLDEAFDHSQQALRVLIQVYGEDHLVVAGALNGLANVEVRQGQLGDALLHYTQSVEMYERHLGADHPRPAMARYNLGVFQYRELKDLDAAVENLQRSVAAAEKAWDEYDTNTNIFALGLALVLSDLGRLAEAEALLRRAIEAFAATRGDNTENLAVARAELGRVRMLVGDTESARNLLESSLPVLIAHFGEDDVDVHRARSALAELNTIASR